LKSFIILKQILDYLRRQIPYSKILGASMGTGEMNDGLGAMFYQTDEEGEERVISYASRQLLKHKRITLHS
jgi:hypothetical protein